MPESSPAVVAGSKAFVDALQPVLRIRLGVSPIAVQDPAALAAAAAAAGRLVVLEHGGPEWLAAVQAVRAVRARGTLSIVAAVPVARSGDTAALRGAGVDDAIRWEGQVDAILGALERLPPAGPAAPAAQPPRAPGPPPLPRAAPAGPPALKPVAMAPPLPPPRAPAPPPCAPAPPQDPPPPVLQRPAAAAPPPALAPAPPAAPAAPAPPAQAPGPDLLAGADPFAGEDLFAGDDPFAAPPAAPSGEAVDLRELLSPADPAAQSAVAAPQVEALLAAALAGQLPEEGPRRELTAALLPQLGELERAALGGGPVPCDPAPLRAAAALRWRVAAARRELAGRDPAALALAQALPAEIDAALTQLKAAGEGGAPEVNQAIGELRKVLVSEAVQLTEAMSLLQPAGEPAPRPAGPAKGPAVGRVRVDQPRTAAPRNLRRRRQLVMLALVLAAGVGYHVVRAALHRPPAPTIPNLPANATGVERGPGKIISALPGKRLDPAEVERLRAAERAKGNAMKEIAPGTWLIYPDKPEKK